MQYGTSRSRVVRLPPARLSRMIRKSSYGYVRELRAAGAFADRPDPGRARLQPVIDANVAAAVQLDAGLLESDPGGVRDAARRDQDVAAFDVLLAGSRAHVKANLCPGSAAHFEQLGLERNSNTFVAENPLHLSATSTILPGHELRPVLDDRHAAAEATIGLGQFETDIAAAEHDQM